MSLSLNNITVNNSSVGINFEKCVTQYLFGNQLNEWHQGVPKETDPTSTRLVPSRITSLNNIAFPGCYLEYEIPEGWRIAVNSWDGSNVSTFNDDTEWVTVTSGIIKKKNKFFTVTLSKTNEQAITPQDAPDIKIHIFDDINNDSLMIEGDQSKTNELNFKEFTNTKFEAGKIIKIIPRFKTWPTDKNPGWAANYARFVLRYKDINDVYHELISVLIKNSLNDFYELRLPDDMNTEHKLEIGVRCNTGFFLVFDVEELQEIDNDFKYYSNAYITGINSSGTIICNGWLDGDIYNYTDGCYHIVIKIEPNDKIIFKANSLALARVAFVKSYDIFTTTTKIRYTVDYCSSFSTGPITIQSGVVSQLYEMPSDAKYAIIGYHYKNEDYNHLPEYFLINDYDILTSAAYKIQNINPQPVPSDTNLIVNSHIFHTVQLAWTDKDNLYECWPNSGVFADGDDIVIIYTACHAHVDTNFEGDIIMRKKTTLSGFYEKKTILEHNNGHAFINPSVCMLNNGDYFMIYMETYETASTGWLKMLKSSDKGETWSNLGPITINGEDLKEECCMSVFCTSTNKIISFAGGVNYRKFIASDDNGQTWRFVGDELPSALEAGFYESSSGYIYAILRQNSNTPALIRLNAALTEYDIIYNFGQFRFPAYYNPTCITKLPNGKLFLFGGSRISDRNGKYGLYEAIVSEEDMLNNNIISRKILKSKTTYLPDWGYAAATIASDGNIYGYYYDGSETGRGVTEIYELIGC